MAKSIKFRSFCDGENTVTFSSIRFRQALRVWQEKQKEITGTKPTLDDAYNLIADKVHVSSDAVRNWDHGKNGVNDLITIKNTASALDIDYKDIVVMTNDSTNTDSMFNTNFEPDGNNEKNLIVQMYKLFSEYIYLFLGGIECYAGHFVEDPEEKANEYLWKLYRFLDQIALDISRDTYNKIRMTITELSVISNPTYGRTNYIPDLWIELNPRLKSNIFAETFLFISDVWDIFDNHDNEEIDDMFHMLLEDVPEAADHSVPFSVSVTNSKTNKSMEVRVKPGDFSKAKQFYCLRSSEPPSAYEIISREFANTLIEVMRTRFPQYFESNKNN